MSRNYYFSRCPEYLEKYRIKIENLIAKNKNNFKLKRVTFIADKEMYFKTTRLFSIKNFREDNKFYINNEKIRWKDLSNKKTINKVTEYSTGVDKSTLELFYKADINFKIDGLKNKELENILTKLKDSGESFYNFSKLKGTNEQTVLSYYLNKLHSENGSSLFIVGKENSNNVKVFGNSYKKHFVNDIKLSSDFSPNLGIIKIKKDSNVTTIILNTYMDIVKNIVKMEIITNGHNKFKSLNNDVQYILQQTKDQPALFSNSISIRKKAVKKISGN